MNASDDPPALPAGLAAAPPATVPPDAAIEGQVRPLLDRFDLERQRIVRSYAAIAAGVGIAAFAAAVWLGVITGEFGWSFMVAIIAAGLLLWVWQTKTADFVLRFKDQVVRRVLRAIGPDLDYQPGGMIARSDFEASGLFEHRIDRYAGEDLAAGHVGPTALRFSEIHAEYKTTTTDSKGRSQTTWHTIFKGLFVVADCNKNFAGRTMVLPDTLQGLLGGFGQTLQSLATSRGELIKLEDPDFEKAFVVYGTDQVEARYLLSPSLMRRILAFRAKAGGKLHVAFADANVFLAIASSEDRFEPRFWRSLRDTAFIRDLVADVHLAVGVVEDLNLNTRIWSKR